MLRHFREAFRADPPAAYRQWFRAQEEFNEGTESETARALAADLRELLPELTFESASARARFFHNLGVFFGTPGHAADLAGARECFAAALTHFSEPDEAGWQARTLHNLATALANLGATRGDLEESVVLFERALAWRTAERAIARGVSLHHLGLALRRLAELDPARAPAHLRGSAQALREAASIREASRLPEGHALSRLHLGMTLALAAESGVESPDAARIELERAAELLEEQGKTELAASARARAAETDHGD